MKAAAIRLLRNVAATVVTVSGIALVGALWFRDLTGTALLDALIGSIYLFIGIGLYGRSRFTLFLATAVAAAHIAFLAGSTDTTEMADPMRQLRLLADMVVILCCVWVLWQVRHDPSV